MCGGGYEAIQAYVYITAINHVAPVALSYKSCDVLYMLTGVCMIPPLSCRISQMYFSGSTLPSFSNYRMEIIGYN